MITRAPPVWQVELATALRSPSQLLAHLGLSAALTGNVAADGEFPMRVPWSYVRRMRKGDALDPLLRQVLPVAAEGARVAGYRLDPVGDLAARAAPGVLAKYQGRALLVATGACAIHCRYCFRRHFPYAESSAVRNDWREALDYITRDRSIREVILSGGDPLSLSDERLASLGATLAGIPHVARLRIHTRMPVALPARVDERLLDWLSRCRQQTVVVVHANHANELNAETAQAMRALAGAGATLLNQTVLLKGVNDTVQSLHDLSESLFAAGVLPYYLHQLDRVQGAAHFEVSDRRASALVARLRDRLPGYLVPRLVREVPGAGHKLPLESRAAP